MKSFKRSDVLAEGIEIGFRDALNILAEAIETPNKKKIARAKQKCYDWMEGLADNFYQEYMYEENPDLFQESLEDIKTWAQHFCAFCVKTKISQILSPKEVMQRALKSIKDAKNSGYYNGGKYTNKLFKALAQEFKSPENINW